MNQKRQIEIFSAGCQVCQETIDMVNRLASSSCEITILNMNEKGVAARAKELGIRSVPAVAVNGQLAECCASRGVEESTLRSTGIDESN